MAQELILHIGVTKTGSTAIQNTLVQSRAALRQLGVYVQNRPAEASHSLLPASILEDLSITPGRGHPMWGGVSPENRLARFRRDFEEEMSNLPDWAVRCVISSEHLSNWLFRDIELSRLASLLHRFFEKVTVVVYLRRQDQHLASSYNERLKAGIVSSRASLRKPEELKSLDYNNLVLRYAKAFGRQAIRARIFARDDLLNQNVIEDFLQTVNIGLSLPPEVESNQGINLHGQTLLACAIMCCNSDPEAKGWITSPAWRVLSQAVETHCRGAGWKLPEAEAKSFMDQFAESNENVRSAFFPERKLLFSTDFDVGGSDPASTSPTPELETAMNVMFRLAKLHCDKQAHAAMTQYRLAHRLGDQTAVRAALLQALRHAPNLIVARLKLAELVMSEGQFAEAGDHLDVVLQNDPNNVEAHRLIKRLTRIEVSSGQS